MCVGYPARVSDANLTLNHDKSWEIVIYSWFPFRFSLEAISGESDYPKLDTI